MLKTSRLSIKKKVILILLLLIIPIILYIVVSNIYTIHNFSDEIAESYKNGFQMYCTNLETEIEMVEAQMAMTVVNDVNFQKLTSNLNQYDYQNYSYNILQTFQTWLSLRPSIAAFGILSEPNAGNRFLFNDSNVDVNLKFEIQQYFADGYEVYKKQPSWFCLKINETPFLMRIIGQNGTYIVCLLNLRTLPTIKADGNTGDGVMLFCTEEEALTEEAFVEENDIYLKASEEDYYTISVDITSFMVITDAIASTDISVAYIIEYGVFARSFQWTGIFLIVLSLVVVILIPTVYYLLRKVFFNPVDNLIDMMSSINEDKSEPVYDAYDWDKEFLPVIDTFRSMMDQIKNLQRITRQKEMEAKQTEIQYLQLQIRPHFFLNCLKNVYSLANRKDYTMIQNATLLLSDYYRAIMLDNMKLIQIKKELEHVKSYLALEELLSGRKVNCQFSVEIPLLNKYIPPISILTFVENSVKYGYSGNMILNLTISVESRMADYGRQICVSVADKGKGFSNGDMDILNADPGISGEHIGISNVRKRFEIIFGDRFNFNFYSDNGAVVEFFFPVLERENDEGAENESFNCR